jgi:glycosyltransferase involved in cell wall biosynthesis
MRFQDLIINLEYIIEDKIGLSNARNKAIETCKTDFITYLDDDVIISKSYLSRMIWLIKNINFDCIGGMFFPFYTSQKPKWFLDKYAEEEKFFETIHPIEDDYVTGLNMMFKLTTLKEVKGFPINFGMKGNKIKYGEDDFVQLEIRKNRGVIYFDPDFYVYHAVQNYKLSLKWQLISRYKSSYYAYLINRKEKGYILFFLLLRSLSGCFLKRLPMSLKMLIIDNKYYFQNLILDCLNPVITILGKLSAKIINKVYPI